MKNNFIFTTLLLIISKSGTYSYKDPVVSCSSAECITAAARFISNINYDVDPCDNFYEFACGKFMNNKDVPPYDDMIKSVEPEMNSLNYAIKQLVTNRGNPTHVNGVDEMQKFYKLCMNEEVVENKSLSVLSKYLDKFGGWPILKGIDWNEHGFNWVDSTAKMSKEWFEIDYFIKLEVEINLMDDNKYMITLDQGSLGVDRDYLVDALADDAKTYYNYMKNVIEEFTPDKPVNTGELNETIDFLHKLAIITKQSEELFEPVGRYNLRTIGELQNEIPQIDWLQYVNERLPADVQVESGETINIKEVQYIKDLLCLFSDSPKRLLANYLMWRVVQQAMPYLNKKMRRHHSKYIEATFGQMYGLERMDECVDMTNKFFHIIISSAYYWEHYIEHHFKAVTHMSWLIAMGVYFLTDKSNILDSHAKKITQEKFDSLEFNLGFPIGKELIQSYYKNLSLNGDNYLEAAILVFQNTHRNYLNKLQQSTIETEWMNRPNIEVVDAFNHLKANRFDIPYNLLKGMYFGENRNIALNYGGLGSIITYQMAHFYDHATYNYDDNGALIKSWTKYSLDNNDKGMACIINQYSAYEVPAIGLKINGKRTLTENLADNAGIQIAYTAHQLDKKTFYENIKNPLISLENFTDYQLFWLAYANTHCTNYHPKKLEHLIRTGSHAPAEFRVNGPLRNSVDFANDFKCAEGSYMNPKDKCPIW